MKLDTKTQVAKNAKNKRGIASSDLNSCISFTPDPGTDADGDGIAAEKNYTFNCSGEGDGSYTYTWKGTMKVTDKNDTGGPSSKGYLGGYRYEFSMPEYVYESSNGSKTGYSHDGYWDVIGTDSTLDYTADYTGGVKGTYVNIQNLGTVSVDYTYHYKFVGHLTHDVAWTNGTASYTGEYTWNGTYLDEDQNGAHAVKTGNAGMTVKTEDLTFDNSCTKWYKSGSWVLSDSNGGVMRITYACTSVKTYLNDQEVTGTNL
jgi:hypothetical protein